MPTPNPPATPCTRPTGSSARRPPIAGSDIRVALLGRYSPDMTVTRQAWRIIESDTDELIVLQARGEWWVGRRRGETITVWACQSELHADETYDTLLADTAGRGQWHEAHARSAA
jgi:hypothetical protein